MEDKKIKTDEQLTMSELEEVAGGQFHDLGSRITCVEVGNIRNKIILERKGNRYCEAITHKPYQQILDPDLGFVFMGPDGKKYKRHH